MPALRTLIVILILCTGMTDMGAAHAAAPPRIWHVLFNARSAPGLYQPSGVAVGGRGNIFVADSGNDRIVELTPQYRFIRQYGTHLQSDPNFPFNMPTRLAVDVVGNVYVADTRHNRILKLSPSLRLLAQWNPGLILPRGVAIDSGGNVYVADTGHDRMVKLSRTGRVIGHWMSPDAMRDGSSFQSVAIDRAGMVYAPVVLDAGPNCDQGSGKCGPDITQIAVEKFSSKGAFLGTVRTFQKQVGASLNISVAAGPRGELYVTGTGGCGESGFPSDRVDWRSPSGAWRGWGSLGAQQGQFDGSASIATDLHGNVYVADMFNGRVQKFTRDGGILARGGTAGGGPGWFASPGGLTLDAHGNVYINDERDNRVQKLSPNGNSSTTVHKRTTPGWGAFTCAGARLLDPPNEGVAVAPNGDIYASNSEQGTIQRLSTTDTLVAQTTASLPFGLVVNTSSGSLFASINDANHIARLSSDLSSTTVWKLPTATGLALGGGGNLWVADTVSDRVVKVSPAGAVLNAWGNFGTAPGQFIRPSGIAVDPRGWVYVADTGNNRIQLFTPNGIFVRAWGSAGSLPGQFHLPAGIAVDKFYDVFVADSGNNRVQELYSGLPTSGG